MTPAEEMAYGIVLAHEDPPAFVEWLFGVTLWQGQKDIVNAFWTKRETAVKSCHSSGKTFVAAASMVAKLFWAACEKNAGADAELIIVSLAAKESQLQETVWGEVNALAARCRFPLPKPTALKMVFGPKIYAVGVATDNPTTLHGHHAREVDILIDEAAGIENAEMLKALRSLTASGKSRVLYLMNPTRAAGPEVDLFSKPRVHSITIDAFDSPNFAGITPEELFEMDDAEGGPLDAVVVDHLISRRYAREVYDDEGLSPGSGWWPRVRGHFPQQDQDSLLYREWIVACHTRQLPRQEWEEYEVICGLDVAGPGDDETTLYARKGPQIVYQAFFKEPDPHRMGQILRIQLAHIERDHGAILALNIDSAGIGHYLASYLVEVGLPVIPVNAGHRSWDKERFFNYKAEAYWSLRERFRRTGEEDYDGPTIGGQIDALCQEQLANIRYGHTTQNQVQIETKKEARRRGVKSPDRAEALMLCFAGRPDRKVARDVRYLQADSSGRRESKWRKKMSTTGHERSLHGGGPAAGAGSAATAGKGDR